MGTEPIVLIVPAGVSTSANDRFGGVAQGGVAAGVANVIATISPDVFNQALAVIAGQLSAATAAMHGAVHGFEVSEISVALAVSADGSIGIATAGVQGSIEITLRKPDAAALAANQR